MIQPKVEQFGFTGVVIWDFFAKKQSPKLGALIRISQTGCVIKTQEQIELRRWIRLIIQDPLSNVLFLTVGRVIKSEKEQFKQKRIASLLNFRQHPIEELPAQSEEPLPHEKYHHEIEFTYPNYFSFASTSLISDLSRRNFKVRSCRSLNSKSAFRPELLA